jgi:hypothetical protein
LAGIALQGGFLKVWRKGVGRMIGGPDDNPARRAQNLPAFRLPIFGD